MKKSLIISLAVFAIGIVFVSLGSVYKFEIYHAAIGFEASQSELTAKKVTISIGDISYYENQQSADKPSVLLVHGFGAYKENWLRFTRPFKDDFHVVVIDLPGHGSSAQSMDLSYTLNNQVAWLNEFTQAVGLTTFHMAGNSMGGAITAQYTSHFPEQVLSAHLIDPAGVHDFRSVMQDYLDKGINPLVLKDPSGFSALMDFALEQPPFVPWPLTEVSALRAIALKEVHEKLWLDIREGLQQDFKQQLTVIKKPVFIQWGEEDRVINYKNMSVFEKLIPNVKTHLWAGVGHAPMIEIPYESAQLMIAQISEI